MIKLCIDSTSLLHEFHLFEPYLYGVMKRKDCFFVNDFSKDNSDIENFDVTIRDAENILLEHRGTDYEVTITSELLDADMPLVQKLYEIDKYIVKKFRESKIQKTNNITIILLDHTGNSYVDFKQDLYVVKGESDLFFTEKELIESENKFRLSKNKQEFINNLLLIKERKNLCRENEWYFYIFSKMLEHFNDPYILENNGQESINICELFARLMSYFVKKEIVDNKLILRYDMFSEKDFYSADKKNFTDMNKIIALLSFDMGDFLQKSKTILYKGIFSVNIGLDNDKIQKMLSQYSENLKAQLEFLTNNKPTKIEVAKKIMPNVSLRNIYLEPVKIKNERLTFFKSSRNIQYLDRVEKNLTIAINKRIKRAKSHNVQNICDLRTLRFIDDKEVEKEKLTLIEIKDKIEEKINEYKRKNAQIFNNRADYYEILEDFLSKQKREKQKIIREINKKVKITEFILSNIALFIVLTGMFLVTCPDVGDRISDTKTLLITLGVVAASVLFSGLGVFIAENIKINRKIKDYVEFVNQYNSKLQVSSNEEIKKLSNTYELIILNSDIEYYKEQYNKILNLISKYEFHIAQMEKHIQIVQRLCARAGVKFHDIVIANDTIYDEKNVDVDIDKDVYENECYSIMHFLFETKDYCMMLNSGEVMEKMDLATYIKSINFTEDEVYKF